MSDQTKASEPVAWARDVLAKMAEHADRYPDHRWYFTDEAPFGGEIARALRAVLAHPTAAAQPVSSAYTLPDTVQAIVDAASAYEKKHGHWQDYRMAMRDDAHPVDKTERAIVVAYRKYAAIKEAA